MLCESSKLRIQNCRRIVQSYIVQVDGFTARESSDTPKRLRELQQWNKSRHNLHHIHVVLGPQLPLCQVPLRSQPKLDTYPDDVDAFVFRNVLSIRLSQPRIESSCMGWSQPWFNKPTRVSDHSGRSHEYYYLCSHKRYPTLYDDHCGQYEYDYYDGRGCGARGVLRQSNSWKYQWVRQWLGGADSTGSNDTICWVLCALHGALALGWRKYSHAKDAKLSWCCCQLVPNHVHGHSMLGSHIGYRLRHTTYSTIWCYFVATFYGHRAIRDDCDDS